ncbi:MAG: hypothetical protein VYE64_00515 [Planctomycetota bacterium]|nr:hypothetical protein [Planctomycetota bacterium]
MIRPDGKMLFRRSRKGCVAGTTAYMASVATQVLRRRVNTKKGGVMQRRT